MALPETVTVILRGEDLNVGGVALTTGENAVDSETVIAWGTLGLVSAYRDRLAFDLTGPPEEPE